MDKTNLYTASQLARACSVSRATILRLEADGLLEPVSREGTAEYRYYDCRSIMHVLQILALQKMGFTRREIHEYFRLPGDFNNCLAVLEERLVKLQEQVDRMRLRVDLENHMKVIPLHLPETVYYGITHRFEQLYLPLGFNSPGADQQYRIFNDSTQDAIREAVNFGLSVDCEKDFFSLVDCPSMLSVSQTDRAFDCTTCIPLSDPPGTPRTVTLPACDCLAITWYHGHGSRHEAYRVLGEAIRERGLIPDGPLRVIGIIHQYMGADISVQRNVIRIAQPVKNE